MLIYQDYSDDGIYTLREFCENWKEYAEGTDRESFAYWLMCVLFDTERGRNDLHRVHGSETEAKKICDMCFRIAKAHHPEMWAE